MDRSHDTQPSTVENSLMILVVLLAVYILWTVSDFWISSTVCLIGYIVHTIAHQHHHKEDSFTRSGRTMIGIRTIVIIGWISFGLMTLQDPRTLDLPRTIALPLGSMLFLGGIALPLSARRERKGFVEENKLVTTGVHSYMKHPMYVGLILMHIGAPIMFQSALTLLSSVIWVTIIVYWMKIDEATLEETYGKEYVDYKNKTPF